MKTFNSSTLPSQAQSAPVESMQLEGTLFPDPKVLEKKCEHGVSMLAWAYNEEDNIERFVDRALKLMRETAEDFEIVIVDDGSRDKTPVILARLSKENPEIRVITNPVNRNVNYCWQLAIKSARKEYLFWQMVDWCYDIEKLRRFLELLKKYDVVQGVRRAPVEQRTYISRKIETLVQLFSVKHLTSRSDTVSKAFISLINYCLIRALFRIPLSDYHNVMFCKTSHFQALNFESRGSFPEPVIKFYWAGLSFVEVPVSFISRKAGVAKGTRFPQLFRATRDVITLWLRWVVFNKITPKRPVSVRRLNMVEWAD